MEQTWVMNLDWRYEFLSLLREMKDTEFQERYWLSSNDHRRQETLGFLYDFFIVELELHRPESSNKGVVLKKCEFLLGCKVGNPLANLMRVHGQWAPTEKIINDPQWAAVVLASDQLYGKILS